MKTLRELCKDYEASDSVSMKALLSDEIESLIGKYLSCQYNIAVKCKSLAFTEFQYSDYRPENGHLALDQIYDDKVLVIYTDMWSYGGSCKETFTIKFSDYESFQEKAYTDLMKSKKKKSIQREISNLQDRILVLEKQLEELSNDD